MYNVVTKTDKNSVKSFDTFKDAINNLKNEVEEWREYFEVEKISDVFFKIWHRCEPEFGRSRYMYAGCVYLKKVN